ncbi:MAG: type II toxin-antitoxin system VapC family toxin [Thermoplasmata archaeon]|nr:MAG: type II toxin-antitoxin system VapC family toxin [Thermoplasmata archaeon]
MKLVLDSSVIAKLFVDEVNSNDAIEIINISHEKDIELIASELVIYEVGNIIYKHLKKRKGGKKYIKQLFLLNIEYIQLNQNPISKAMEIAQKNTISYYDAVHVGISKQIKAPLVTEDKELLKKLKNTLNIHEVLEYINKHS